MKVIKTATGLIISIIAFPVILYYFGDFPGIGEWVMMKKLLWVCLFSILLTFITSELTRNYSQVDKLWSLLPILYVWLVAFETHWNTRLGIMSILVTIWGIRLTWNFALKGAYRWKFWEGEEDYRWKVLRSRPEFQKPWKWRLFNLLFICGYQSILILMFCLPAVVAMQKKETPLNGMDILIALSMLGFILMEAIADRQQWNYQKAKRVWLSSGKVTPMIYQRGFLQEGLWAHSRHPNYFAEQAIWFCFYLFSVSSGGNWINWSLTGCLLLILLFQGSANFSEEISAGKYPEYNTYQQQVPKFIPRIF